MQSPASSIQSPRPQGRSSAQPQISFDKELMTSLHVLLNQLGEVERQGLVMFHKIEESFKHPYSQQEAVNDTANLLTQLDTLSTQAKTTGFSALTMLPTSPTVVSTPSASSAISGTPKPTFMSPRMQNHIHNNLNTNPAAANSATLNNSNTNNTSMDTQMLSPAPVSLVSTPAGATPSATAATAATNYNNTAPSPFPSSDVIMSSSTPAASSNMDASSAGGATDLLATTPMNAATPATPSANSLSSGTSNVALTQMMEARQKDVNAQYTERRKLMANFKIAAQMTKI
ncbi:hypothetical protein BGX21_009834 [Mortierella sp. AD011]|nr:hypothetical protein BGX20_010169 [Mortierella sp. AD010]KAF9402503.1 hypothetical protein BGX21_009834 [Mortierella sp. AD011]